MPTAIAQYSAGVTALTTTSRRWQPSHCGARCASARQRPRVISIPAAAVGTPLSRTGLGPGSEVPRPAPGRGSEQFVPYVLAARGWKVAQRQENLRFTVRQQTPQAEAVQTYQIPRRHCRGAKNRMEHSPSLCVLLKMEQMPEALQWRPQPDCECYYPRNEAGGLRQGDEQRVATSDATQQALAGLPDSGRRAVKVGGSTPSRLACPSLQARSTHLAPVRVRRLAEFSHELPTWKGWRGGRCRRRRLLRHSRCYRRRHCQLGGRIQQAGGLQTRGPALPAAGVRLMRGPCAAAQVRGMHGLESQSGDMRR